MCDICHQNPCSPRCPNADDGIIGKCIYCDDEIMNYNMFYTDDMGNLFCSESCALKYYGIEAKFKEDLYEEQYD